MKLQLFFTILEKLWNIYKVEFYHFYKYEKLILKKIKNYFEKIKKQFWKK